MATIKDVAKRAGVSVATVSRVLNKNGYVNQETELRVLAAIDELEYQPNLVARTLANKRSGTIALILPDITNPFFPELARAIEDVARSHQYTVILCNSDDQFAREISYVELLAQRYIEGIIFASNTLSTEDIMRLKNQKLPMVVLDRALDYGYCNVVRCNNYLGAKMAVDHLLSIGCQKIAHISGAAPFITAMERLRGYEDRIRTYEWFSPDLTEPGHFTLEGGRQATLELLRRHPDLDGIFAGNDLMAIGALKALRQLGIEVPKQVSICGFDGIALTEITEPELTTVAQPIYEMGATAAKLLFAEIQGTLENKQVYELDVSLIQRASTERSGDVVEPQNSGRR
ncbi:LacI family DNA-binding transcriptional regulator [Brevibacillus fluminis]|uniref:LacI family DNA-binding transcriptional regulator n=1 Tax=Brevibacillus fluminis TaxID=511487 RepID=UPI003F8ADE14